MQLSSALKLHEGKRARILAVTTEKRIDILKDIPTMIEAGVPNFVSDTWNAVSAPPGTPAAIVAKLNKAINDAMDDPETEKRFTDLADHQGRRQPRRHAQADPGRDPALGRGDQAGRDHSRSSALRDALHAHAMMSGVS